MQKCSLVVGHVTKSKSVTKHLLLSVLCSYKTQECCHSDGGIWLYYMHYYLVDTCLSNNALSNYILPFNLSRVTCSNVVSFEYPAKLANEMSPCINGSGVWKL